MMDISSIEAAMTAILGTMIAIIIGIIFLQTPLKDPSITSSFLPSPENEPSKYAFEKFTLLYTPFWISVFAYIVIFQTYEDFNAWSYIYLCCGLASPLLLQPIVFPSAFFGSPDANRPLSERYCSKATLWIFVYSFIGNYWYTHYFYSVLKASYTFPSHRLNNVPIALIFATHFYFSTYHCFSNMMLRKIITTYEPGFLRSVLFWSSVLAFAYFTAFAETLTISSFPYYSFEDRYMAYTVGSAFYGIYFIVSFPAFFYEFQPANLDKKEEWMSLWNSFVSSCGHGMMIMCLLDFVRLGLGIDLVVGS